MTTNNEILTTTIKGQITATSNSVGRFKDNDRKTVYITVTDAESLKVLKDMGITEYTSKDGDKFFIFKASDQITLWLSEKEREELDTSIKSGNFETTKEVKIGFISGTSKEYGNKYHRIFAIGLEDRDDLIIKEKQNPFI